MELDSKYLYFSTINNEMDCVKKNLVAYGNKKSLQIYSSLKEHLNTSQNKKQSCYLVNNNVNFKI